MVFTNPITTNHVNKTSNQPPMSSMVVGGNINADATNLKKGYWEPFVVTTQIHNHKYGHYVRPNRVAIKYRDF